jgi:hypothetical protein
VRRDQESSLPGPRRKQNHYANNMTDSDTNKSILAFSGPCFSDAMSNTRLLVGLNLNSEA